MPEPVKSWLSEGGFDEGQTLALVVEPETSLAKAIHAEMSRLGSKTTGAMHGELTVQNALAGGLFMVRGKRKNGQSYPEFNFFNLEICIPKKFAVDGLVKYDSHVNIDFPIFDCRNENCFAEGALPTDPGYLLGIRLRGVNDAGDDWHHFCHSSSEKGAKKANTIVDWLTNTGVAVLDHHIPRRYYKIKKGGDEKRVYT